VKIYVAAVEALGIKEARMKLSFPPKLGLSDPAPTSAPSIKSRSGISWMG